MGNIYNNKNAGLSDSETVNEIKKRAQAIDEEIEKIEASYKEHIENIAKLNQKYSKRMKEVNPYAIAIEQMHKEKEALSADIDNTKSAKEKRLAIEKWYNDEYQKIVENRQIMSNAEKQNAFLSLDSLYNQRSMQAEEEVWEERGQKIGNIVGKGFEDILTEFGNFDGSMRKMAKRLYDYLIEESMNALMTQIFGMKQMQSIGLALTTGSKKGGWIGTASSLLKGVGKAFGVFHSGGVVPVGANTELPGTKEQLALLKGGERILSPSENTDYKNGQGVGTSPVVFNNFNIKAWDSKDVQKYLMENKTLLNQITYEGIKDNRNQLRQMVRNA